MGDSFPPPTKIERPRTANFVVEDIKSLEYTIPHIAEAVTSFENWLSDEDLVSIVVGLSRYYNYTSAEINPEIQLLD